MSSQWVAVVGTYKGERGADEALPVVKAAAKTAKLKVHDAGIIRRTAADKVEVKDTGDWGFAKGFVAGGAVGALAIAVSGPIGWTVAGAGIVTGLAARLHDAKISDDEMRGLGQSLTTGNSALMVMVDAGGEDGAKKILQDAGGTVMTLGLDEAAVGALGGSEPSAV